MAGYIKKLVIGTFAIIATGAVALPLTIAKAPHLLAPYAATIADWYIHSVENQLGQARSIIGVKRVEYLNQIADSLDESDKGDSRIIASNAIQKLIFMETFLWNFRIEDRQEICTKGSNGTELNNNWYDLYSNLGQGYQILGYLAERNKKANLNLLQAVTSYKIALHCSPEGMDASQLEELIQSLEQELNK